MIRTVVLNIMKCASFPWNFINAHESIIDTSDMSMLRGANCLISSSFLTERNDDFLF